MTTTNTTLTPFVLPIQPSEENIHSVNSLPYLCAFLSHYTVNMREYSAETKILAYIASYAVEYHNSKRYYYVNRGSKKQMCEILKLSESTCNKTINKLLEMGFLKQGRQTTRKGDESSGYPYYYLAGRLRELNRDTKKAILVMRLNVPEDDNQSF